jgi:succinate dehydrogenase / fumarate reductase cytochrome b subunit
MSEMKFALYTGCAAKGACPELYQSSMKVIQKLGLEVVELKDATCCGAGVIREGDPELSLAINARTFSMAESMGLNVMTICGTCQGVMVSALKQLKEEEGLMDRVNALLAMDHRKYAGTSQTKHLLWILAKEIGISRLKEYVVRPLDGLRVAPFYGCYILRPSWDLGFDDPVNPTSLESVISTLGAEPVDYSGRTKCCGFPIILEKEDIATGMASANLAEAKEKGADCLVTPCPLCHMSLDLYQERAEEKANTRLGLPILHLAQLVGLAMGLSSKDLGLARHMVSVEKVLEKIGAD